MCFKTQGLYKCGKCPECLQERRLSWSLRLMQFARENSCFSCLLTYRPADVPLTDDGQMTLSKRHIQKFIKRLRHHFNEKIKYFISAEYSPQKLRPHYHCLLFGIDKEMERDSIKKILQETWGLGYVGSRSNWLASDAQIVYTTNYLVNLYEWNDDDLREKPFNLMSKGLAMEYHPADGKDFIRDIFQYGWFFENGSWTYHTPLSWNPERECFDVDSDFIENIDTIKIQQTVFNPKTKVTKLDKVHSYPMPRVWRESYFTYDERHNLNILKAILALKRYKQYMKEYGEYDKTTDFPMWKQLKYSKWNQRKKNKKDKRLSNPDMYLD